MHVTFDARYPRNLPSGMGAYTRALIERLPALAPAVQFTVWVSPTAPSHPVSAHSVGPDPLTRFLFDSQKPHIYLVCPSRARAGQPWGSPAPHEPSRVEGAGEAAQLLLPHAGSVPFTSFQLDRNRLIGRCEERSQKSPCPSSVVSLDPKNTTQDEALAAIRIAVRSLFAWAQPGRSTRRRGRLICGRSATKPRYHELRLDRRARRAGPRRLLDDLFAYTIDRLIDGIRSQSGLKGHDE